VEPCFTLLCVGENGNDRRSDVSNVHLWNILDQCRDCGDAVSLTRKQKATLDLAAARLAELDPFETIYSCNMIEKFDRDLKNRYALLFLDDHERGFRAFSWDEMNSMSGEQRQLARSLAVLLFKEADL